MSGSSEGANASHLRLIGVMLAQGLTSFEINERLVREGVPAEHTASLIQAFEMGRLARKLRHQALVWFGSSVAAIALGILTLRVAGCILIAGGSLAVIIMPAVLLSRASRCAEELKIWQNVPAILDTPPPRNVHLRPHLMRPAIIGCVVACLLYGSQTLWGLRTMIRLRADGRNGSGTVTGRCSELNGVYGPKTYAYLSYRYSVHGVSYKRHDGLTSRAIFQRGLRVGSPIPVTYLPTHPDVSAAIAHDDITIPQLLYFSSLVWGSWALLALVLSHLSGGVRKAAAKEFHLARWGVLVDADVVDGDAKGSTLRFAVGDRYHEAKSRLSFFTAREHVPVIYDPRDPNLNLPVSALKSVDFSISSDRGHSETSA